MSKTNTVEMDRVNILTDAGLVNVVTSTGYELSWYDPKVKGRAIIFDRMDVMFMSIEEAHKNAAKIKSFISKSQDESN